MPVGPSYRERSSSNRSISDVVGGGADDLRGAGVRNVGQQGTDRQTHRRPEALSDTDDLLAELAPAQRRLGSEHEDHVGAGQRGTPTPRPWATRSNGCDRRRAARAVARWRSR